MARKGVIAAIALAFMAIWVWAPELRSRITYLSDRLFAGRPDAPSRPLETQLNDPTGIWVDGSNTVYFTERRSYLIRRLSGDELLTIAGTRRAGYSGDGRLAAQARLDMPSGLAGDAGGNLVVADSQNHRIRRISADGTISTVAGTGKAGFSGDGGPAIRARLDRPQDVCLGPTGAIFLTDWGNHRIRRISPQGVITTVAGTGRAGFGGDGGPALEASLDGPYGVHVDGEGAIYIADSGNHRVRKVSVDGTITTIAGTGQAGFSGDRGPASAAAFDSPQDVFVAAGGEIFVNDEHNHRIRKILRSGIIVTVAGNGRADFCGDGGPATNACLRDPEELWVDDLGVIFITDGDNHRLRRVDRDGTITTIAGTGPSGRR